MCIRESDPIDDGGRRESAWPQYAFQATVGAEGGSWRRLAAGVAGCGGGEPDSRRQDYENVEDSEPCRDDGEDCSAIGFMLGARTAVLMTRKPAPRAARSKVAPLSWPETGAGSSSPGVSVAEPRNAAESDGGGQTSAPVSFHEHPVLT
jgi:hypothetical protein